MKGLLRRWPALLLTIAVLGAGAPAAQAQQVEFYLPWTAGEAYWVTDIGTHPCPGDLCKAHDFLLPEGTKVRASAAGRVTYVKNGMKNTVPRLNWGNFVTIKHADGTCTRYAHLKKAKISKGPVKQGQVIGKAGNTGYSFGAHLHFQREAKCDHVATPISFVEGAVEPRTLMTSKNVPLPKEGSFVRLPNGTTYRIAGGAPLLVSDCAALGGCSNVQSIAELSALRSFPRDGTFIRAAEDDAMYRVAGGAPLAIEDCGLLNGCQGPIDVNRQTVDARDHLRNVPADGTTLEGRPSGLHWIVQGGCRSPIDATQGSVQVTELALALIPLC